MSQTLIDVAYLYHRNSQHGVSCQLKRDLSIAAGVPAVLYPLTQQR